MLGLRNFLVCSLKTPLQYSVLFVMFFVMSFCNLSREIFHGYVLFTLFAVRKLPFLSVLLAVLMDHVHIFFVYSGRMLANIVIDLC